MAQLQGTPQHAGQWNASHNEEDVDISFYGILDNTIVRHTPMCTHPIPNEAEARERMSVDLCDPQGLPLSEEVARKIPRFQRAMRTTFGALIFALFAFVIAPLPLVYVGGAIPILLWCGLVNPLSVRLFVDYCSSRFFYVLVCMFENLFGIKTRSFGYNGQFKRRCLFIMNHVSHFDWMFSWGVIERQGDLFFWKAVTKDAIRNLLFIGHIMQLMCHIFLTRKWDKDQLEIEEKICYFNGLNYPIQLLLFPEGGDLTYKTRERSDRYADDNGLPRYNYCLHPHTTGFVCVMNALRSGGLDAVYDVTIGYPDTISKTEIQFGKGIMPREVHFYTKSYDVKDLPMDDDGLAQWCKDRWREKEERLRDFYTHKEFRERMSDNSVWDKKMSGGDAEYQKSKEVFGKKQYFSLICSILIAMALNGVIIYLLTISWSFCLLGVILAVCLVYWNHQEGLDHLIMSFSQKTTEDAKLKAKRRKNIRTNPATSDTQQ